MKSIHLVSPLILAAALSAAAQTQIDLRTQGKNVDFSGATSTKPFRTGTGLPASCSTGETYFRTDAMAGQNLYLCTAANTWSLESGGGGGGGATMASQLTDFGAARTSTMVLTVGANCSTATPCNARFGNTVYSFTNSCTATLTAGTGTAFLYVASGGILTIGHNLTVSAAGGCAAQGNVTNFPAGSIPLYIWTATNGNWDATGGHDFRALLSIKDISAGTGVATLESGGQTTVSVDSALVPTYLTATATIDFPAIANGACATEQPFALPGATAGDSVTPGWPFALEAGLIGTMRVSAANTIAVRLCNMSGSTVDPASATYRATIVRSF
jgi:hypothetical protein